jgi:catalase-peroxidase
MLSWPVLERIQQTFNRAQHASGKQVSLADLIVLGGCAAVEAAAQKAGHNVTVPFRPGRTDCNTGTDRCELLCRPRTCRRWVPQLLQRQYSVSAEELLVDRAQLLTLTAPEMTVLIGGLRVLGANYAQSQHGRFTDRPETLSNDFFVNLLDMNTVWESHLSRCSGV